MPRHRNAFGENASRLAAAELTLSRHATTIIDATRYRQATDSTAAIKSQVAAYFKRVPDIDAFSVRALIDSAFFVRDLQKPRCRQVSAILGCAWLREISCHSDRDQISFPFVLHQMDLHPQVEQSLLPSSSTTSRSVIVFADSAHTPWVAIAQPKSHHWYNTTEIAVLLRACKTRRRTQCSPKK